MGPAGDVSITTRIHCNIRTLLSIAATNVATIDNNSRIQYEGLAEVIMTDTESILTGPVRPGIVYII